MSHFTSNPIRLCRQELEIILFLMGALTCAREHVKIILVKKLPLLSYAFFRIKPPLQFHPMEETMFLSFSCSCHRFVMKEFGRVTPRTFNELGAAVHFNINIICNKLYMLLYKRSSHYTSDF